MSPRTADLLLLTAAAIWGSTFVAQKEGMDHFGPFLYTGLRFFLGLSLLAPLALRQWHTYRRRHATPTPRQLWPIAGLGLLLGTGIVLQQIGIVSTTVSNAGFLTALYIPLVPILAWLLDGNRPHWLVFPLTLLTFFGTFLLAGGQFDGFNRGDGWVILSSLFWALHVHFVGHVVARLGMPIVIAFGQYLVCAVLTTALGLLFEPFDLAALQAGWLTIAYGGILSVGIGFTLQVIAQRHTRPSEAAIILSSEVLFAALGGVLYFGERLTPLQWLGGLLIFVSIVLIQLPWPKRAIAAAPQHGTTLCASQKEERS
ncbi:DMT family transporter [Hydrogenophilus thermoluteolus]|nr:DMT family transporter [Hydrogenophilus thermoluteolus]MBW7655966.1 DMT family transporter [Hydrogenophilus thermoluteolus]HCO77575.1 EamA/RhaT family transporter [Rhodocyclaceae bacterium]